MPAEASDTRAAIPSQTAQAKAMETVQELYGKDISGTKTADQKKALAKKVLTKAEETENDPAGKFVLLKLAKEIAAQASDGPTAFEAIDKMAESFQVDDSDLKSQTLESLAKNARTAADHASVVKQTRSR